jgi:hypothetical protein
MAAYVLRCNADGSDSKFPARGARDWAIDFHLSTDNFMQPGQIGAFYALSRTGEGHDYDGPGPYGPVRYSVHGFRGGGHVVILPDGDIVVSGALYYDYRLGGKSNPAFDLILARFSPEGALKWSTNLYQPNDSVHIPDQKDRDLIYNPFNGDIYVLAVQHGFERDEVGVVEVVQGQATWTAAQARCQQPPHGRLGGAADRVQHPAVAQQPSHAAGHREPHV